MSVRVVDLRSDTVTKPTPEMRQAMAHAEVGDDVFREDPTTRALEEAAAARFGKEAGLFVPSGTMANQLAIHVVSRPGEQAIVGLNAHSVLYETGAAAALSGVQLDVLPSSIFTAEAVATRLHSGEDVHDSRTSMIMVENTHNRSGGVVFPLADLQAIRELAQTRRVHLHMDGARVFNACVAANVAPEVYGRAVDTLNFCLSKGLGCPVGSVLLGDTAFIGKARQMRKRFGGGMRQVGILAAAGLFALEHHVERLADDHRRAQNLAEAWGNEAGVSIVTPPQTNMIYLRIDGHALTAAELCHRLGERGVAVLAVGPKTLRAVVHLGVDDRGIELAAQGLKAALG